MITDERFDELMELVVHGFEIAGVAVLVLGALGAFVHAALVARRDGLPIAYERSELDPPDAPPDAAVAVIRMAGRLRGHVRPVSRPALETVARDMAQSALGTLEIDTDRNFIRRDLAALGLET